MNQKWRANEIKKHSKKWTEKRDKEQVVQIKNKIVELK
jgi:hypothetical protein